MHPYLFLNEKPLPTVAVGFGGVITGSAPTRVRQLSTTHQLQRAVALMACPYVTSVLLFVIWITLSVFGTLVVIYLSLDFSGWLTSY